MQQTGKHAREGLRALSSLVPWGVGGIGTCGGCFVRLHMSEGERWILCGLRVTVLASTSLCGPGGDRIGREGWGSEAGSKS